MTIPTITDDLLGEIEAEAQDDVTDENGFTSCNPKEVLALVARIRELERDAERYRKWRDTACVRPGRVAVALCEAVYPWQVDEALDAMQADHSAMQVQK